MTPRLGRILVFKLCSNFEYMTTHLYKQYGSLQYGHIGSQWNKQEYYNATILR